MNVYLNAASTTQPAQEVIDDINFYLKQGYEVISMRKNYYQDHTNALIMKKVIL